MLTIIELALIQSLYDFAGWYGLYKEQAGHPKEWLFRLVKTILDLFVTVWIAHWYFQVSWVVLAAFFIAKWFHLCDSLYNIWRFILTNEPAMEWGNWRWWTPLGLLRSAYMSKVPLLKGYTELDYRNRTGYWSGGTEEYGVMPMFSKGMVSSRESWIQTAIGLVLAYIILQF